MNKDLTQRIIEFHSIIYLLNNLFRLGLKRIVKLLNNYLLPAAIDSELASSCMLLGL